MEFIISNGKPYSELTISDSVFYNNPGDMLELFNRGVVPAIPDLVQSSDTGSSRRLPASIGGSPKSIKSGSVNVRRARPGGLCTGARVCILAAQ